MSNLGKFMRVMMTLVMAVALGGVLLFSVAEVAASPGYGTVEGHVYEAATGNPLYPTKVGIGETVTIGVMVANTGDLDGTYTVTLKINNAVVDSKQVTVAGGGRERVTFTTSKDTAGTYTIIAGSLSQMFTVVSATPEEAGPGNFKEVYWWLGGGIFASAVLLGITLRFFRRCRY